MAKLIPVRSGMLSELLRASSMGTGRLLATFGTGIIMAPLLCIALMPLLVLGVVMLPPVGMWLAVSSLFGETPL